MIDVVESNFYVIRAKEALLEVLEQYSEASYLGRTVVWAKPEIGRGWATLADDLAMVKIIFLADLRKSDEGITNARVKELIARLLGKPPYEIHSFDRWWELEKVGYGGDWLIITQTIPAALLELFSKTNMPYVDKWIENVVRMKQDQDKTT